MDSYNSLLEIGHKGNGGALVLATGLVAEETVGAVEPNEVLGIAF